MTINTHGPIQRIHSAQRDLLMRLATGKLPANKDVRARAQALVDARAVR